MNKQQLIEELRDLILVSEGKTREGVTGRVGAKFFGSDDHYNFEWNLDGPITIARVLRAFPDFPDFYEIRSNGAVTKRAGCGEKVNDLPTYIGYWNLSNDTAEDQTEETLKWIIEILKGK